MDSQQKSLYTPVFYAPSQDFTSSPSSKKTRERVKDISIPNLSPSNLKILSNLSKRHIALSQPFPDVPPSRSPSPTSMSPADDAAPTQLQNAVQAALTAADYNPSHGKWALLPRLLRLSTTSARTRYLGTRTDGFPLDFSERAGESRLGWCNADTEEQWAEWERKVERERAVKARVGEWRGGVVVEERTLDQVEDPLGTSRNRLGFTASKRTVNHKKPTIADLSDLTSPSFNLTSPQATSTQLQPPNPDQPIHILESRKKHQPEATKASSPHAYASKRTVPIKRVYGRASGSFSQNQPLELSQSQDKKASGFGHATSLLISDADADADASQSPHAQPQAQSSTSRIDAVDLGENPNPTPQPKAKSTPKPKPRLGFHPAPIPPGSAPNTPKSNAMMVGVGTPQSRVVIPVKTRGVRAGDVAPAPSVLAAPTTPTTPAAPPAAPAQPTTPTTPKPGPAAPTTPSTTNTKKRKLSFGEGKPESAYWYRGGKTVEHALRGGVVVAGSSPSPQRGVKRPRLFGESLSQVEGEGGKGKGKGKEKEPEKETGKEKGELKEKGKDDENDQDQDSYLALYGRPPPQPNSQPHSHSQSLVTPPKLITKPKHTIDLDTTPASSSLSSIPKNTSHSLLTLSESVHAQPPQHVPQPQLPAVQTGGALPTLEELLKSTKGSKRRMSTGGKRRGLGMGIGAGAVSSPARAAVPDPAPGAEVPAAPTAEVPVEVPVEVPDPAQKASIVDVPEPDDSESTPAQNAAPRRDPSPGGGGGVPHEREQEHEHQEDNEQQAETEHQHAQKEQSMSFESLPPGLGVSAAVAAARVGRVDAPPLGEVDAGVKLAGSSAVVSSDIPQESPAPAPATEVEAHNMTSIGLSPPLHPLNLDINLDPTTDHIELDVDADADEDADLDRPLPNIYTTDPSTDDDLDDFYVHGLDDEDNHHQDAGYPGHLRGGNLVSSGGRPNMNPFSGRGVYDDDNGEYESGYDVASPAKSLSSLAGDDSDSSSESAPDSEFSSDHEGEGGEGRNDNGEGGERGGIADISFDPPFASTQIEEQVRLVASAAADPTAPARGRQPATKFQSTPSSSNPFLNIASTPSQHRQRRRSRSRSMASTPGGKRGMFGGRYDSQFDVKARVEEVDRLLGRDLDLELGAGEGGGATKGTLGEGGERELAEEEEKEKALFDGWLKDVSGVP